MQKRVFDEFISPIIAFVANAGAKIDEKSGSRKFFFLDFMKIMLFGSSIGVSSLRKLIKELESNQDAAVLELKNAAYSTIRDCFARFDLSVFQELYTSLLNTTPWMSVKELAHLGILKAVDGSLFPTLRSMDWASYKKNCKAIKLHLSFNINQLCSNEFLISDGNRSERDFLKSILERGVTYICDRGYFSFDVLNAMNEKFSLFVLRLKRNILHECCKSLPLTGELPRCFTEVTDELVKFNGDELGKIYRMVRFKVLNVSFILCTNRLDLTTLQVIMLYAYRWQIELMFKYLKHQLKGLHLWAHNEGSSQVHFYLLLIGALLRMRLKQVFTQQKEQHPANPRGFHTTIVGNENENPSYTGADSEQWIHQVNHIFNNSIKITSDWILYLKNFIAQVIDYHIISKLAVT